MGLPTRHHSRFEVIGPLQGAPLHQPEGETPLFAASYDFAFAQGGPITRAFLDALPATWRDAVIDSSLVWLTPGLAHDEPFRLSKGGAPHRRSPAFRHELFPGCADGVRGDANRNLNAVHRRCFVGLSCTPLVARGEVALEPDEDPAGFWLPTDTLTRRDQRIHGWLSEGRLVATPLPVAQIVEHGWGMLHCPRPATRSGFQLMLRATHNDPRPRVNGLRNVSFI